MVIKIVFVFLCIRCFIYRRPDRESECIYFNITDKNSEKQKEAEGRTGTCTQKRERERESERETCRETCIKTYIHINIT